MKIPDLKIPWFWRFFLACITAGVVGTIGSCLEYSVIFDGTRESLSVTGFFTLLETLAGLAILFGVAIGVLFGVSLYKDELVLPNVRKHMLLYWMYWIVVGGAFALIPSIFFTSLAIILGSMG